MRDAEIDQPRFLASGDDFDRESQHVFGLRNEVGGILGHAQGVGADHAHRLARQVAQPFGKPAQRGQRALLGFGIEILVGGEPGGQPTCSRNPSSM